MRPMRLATTLLIPLMIVLEPSCTWVSRSGEECKVACLDLDGDGAPRGDCEACDPEGIFGSYDLPRDCNDEPEQDGAEETPGKPEIPYDGFDNDCSFATDGEHDLIDRDGDGFPGISKSEWEALGTRHRNDWPSDLPGGDGDVDCNDNPDDPNATRTFPKNIQQESWYDGVDENCDGLDDFDQDQDGFAAKYCPDPANPGQEILCADLYASFAGAGWHLGLPGGDCEDVNAQVNPGYTAEEDEFYDGVDKNCDGSNDFDRDGDGFIPVSVGVSGTLNAADWPSPITGIPNLCKAYNIKYKLEVSCNINSCRTTSTPKPISGACNNCVPCDTDTCGALQCDALPHPGDCNDRPAVGGGAPNLQGPAYNPHKIDIWYDGLDHNCDNADDFDADKDGYFPDVYVSTYANYASQPWYDDLETGDCNDIESSVRPGEDEYYGDEFDQDCDGNIDTTPLHFSEFATRNPMPPVIAANDFHYIVGVAASEWYRGTTPGSSPTDAGYALLFAPESGYRAEPVREALWSIPNNPSRPLSGSFDMEASGNSYTVAWTYNHDARNWIFVRSFTTTTAGALYSPTMQQGGFESNEPYKYLDLRRGTDGVWWAWACAENSAQFLSVNFGGSTPVRGSVMEVTRGGHACWLDFNGTQAIGNTWTTQSPSGTYSYRLAETPPPGDIVPIAAEWEIPLLNRATTQGGWFAFAMGAQGLKVSDGINEYTHLRRTNTIEARDYHVRSASVAHADGKIFVLAVVNDVTGDAVPDVVFAHGSPTGILRDVILPMEHPRFPQEPVHPAIFVDDEALIFAVSGKRRESGTTGAKDSVGWGFVRR